MHDFSLGGPVDVGSYDGPMLDGKPIHSGNCEDGVYGCRPCGRAFRSMTPEERQRACPDWPTTQTCDWCHKEVPVDDTRGVRPWDEPSCYYEVCITCHGKYRDEEAKEFAEEEVEAEEEFDYDTVRCRFCSATVSLGTAPRILQEWVCRGESCREKLAKDRIRARLLRAKERRIS